MEENKSQGVLNLINPKNKKATTPKKALTKDDEAKAKVEELLKNTSVASLVTTEPAKPEFDVEEIKQEKSAKWMDEQIELLNKQVEEQENELMFYKNELQRMQAILQAGGNDVQNDQVSLNSGELTPQLVNLFRHFEQVYEAGYTDAKIAHAESGEGILDMLLQNFPQLQNIRRYRYRGQGR